MNDKGYINPLEAIGATLSEKNQEKAKVAAEKKLFKLRLKEMRKIYHITQTNFKGYKHTAISNIENREDIKLSTLVAYLDSIDMGLEIKAIPKHGEAPKEYILLSI